MKKILILLIIAFSGCDMADTKTPLIVTGVREINRNHTIRSSEVLKYKIQINYDVIVYTNTLYKVGDTLK